MFNTKPMFVIANINEETKQEEIDTFKKLLAKNMKLVQVNVRVETDLNDLSDEDKKEFMKEFGMTIAPLPMNVPFRTTQFGTNLNPPLSKSFSVQPAVLPGKCSRSFHALYGPPIIFLLFTLNERSIPF